MNLRLDNRGGRASRRHSRGRGTAGAREMVGGTGCSIFGGMRTPQLGPTPTRSPPSGRAEACGSTSLCPCFHTQGGCPLLQGGGEDASSPGEDPDSWQECDAGSLGRWSGPCAAGGRCPVEAAGTRPPVPPRQPCTEPPPPPCRWPLSLDLCRRSGTLRDPPPCGHPAPLSLCLKDGLVSALQGRVPDPRHLPGGEPHATFSTTSAPGCVARPTGLPPLPGRGPLRSTPANSVQRGAPPGTAPHTGRGPW